MTRYAELRGVIADPKNYTQKGNLKKVAAKQLSDFPHPPATPARPKTGLNAQGQTEADTQGNVYVMHSGKRPSLRETRRSNKFGRNGIQPYRSRIQRQTRKQRTGGVK